MSPQELPVRLLMLADKMNQMYGRNPDADLVREAAKALTVEAEEEAPARYKPRRKKESEDA